MTWGDFKEDLIDRKILWEVPRPSDLEKKIPPKARKMIQRQDRDAIRNEIREHWMNFCTESVLDNYDANMIAEQVGLAAQHETDDFDSIVFDYSKGKADRICMRQYISLIAFNQQDLHRPWEEDDHE